MPRKKTTTTRKTKVKKERTRKPRKRAVAKKIQYWQATGRRKTAVARVRIRAQKEKEFLINEKPLTEYFSQPHLQKKALSPFEILNLLEGFSFTAKIKGGGLSAQAEAIRHAIARALVNFNSNFRAKLKKAGFLRRDPRMKERKKFGLKGARKAPQWSKR